MGNMELLWRQCRGTGHHLALKVESCGFPHIAVGNSWFHLSNYGDNREPLMISQGCQVSFLIARDTSDSSQFVAGESGCIWS